MGEMRNAEMGCNYATKWPKGERKKVRREEKGAKRGRWFAEKLRLSLITDGHALTHAHTLLK